MKLVELKKRFTIIPGKLPANTLKKYRAHSAERFIIDGKEYWAVFKSPREQDIFTFLTSKEGYKVKEHLFGVVIDEGYAYTKGQGEAPDYMQLVLPNKWKIKDRNIEREFTVVVSNIDEENDPLLHELYSKTRS